MQRMMALLSLAVVSAVAFGGDDPASKADLKRLQGKWKIVSIIHNGEPKKIGERSIYNFVGNKNVYGGDGEYDILTLNAKETPKAFDFDVVDEKGKVTYIRGQSHLCLRWRFS